MRKKKIQSQTYLVHNVRYMLCSKCGQEVRNVGETALSVICSRCVNVLVPLEPSKARYQSTGRPAGWHWMAEFVDKDGNVFHKGKEQPKLKGTLKPTKVKPPKKRKTKRRTREQMLVARHKEKKAELKKAVQKQKDFLNHRINKG